MTGTSLHTYAPARVTARRAFTLLELLVVVSIIALLISILMPAMSNAKNEASTAKCLANIRSIAQATAMYMDTEESRVLPWYQYPAHAFFKNQVVTHTPWVFGGFKAPNPDPADLQVDSSLYPAQLRPLNAFIAPDIGGSYRADERGMDIIEVYKCPADRSYTTSLISHDPTEVEEEARSSWEANGSSYTLNTRWAQGYTQPSGNFDTNDFLNGRAPENIPFGAKLAPHLIGDGAARFIIWGEQGFYSATYRATYELPNGAAPLRRGWHRKFSGWTAGFADGHAAHGYYDTRLATGLGGTIWQPNFQPPS